MINMFEDTKTAKRFAIALKQSGSNHVNYKMYTSIERAKDFMHSGYLYLSDGRCWNDISDKVLMGKRQVYARCFSYSTKENIAMWMLYGKNNGREGAMINFYPSVLHSLLKIGNIELGFFEKDQFKTIHTISNNNTNYEIFLTDIVYIDPFGDRQVKLTVSDKHTTEKASCIEHDDIFYKSFAWAYERECRLIVRLSDEWKAKAKEDRCSIVRLRINNDFLKKMDKSRIVRSPIYSGRDEIGVPSPYTGKVDWEL